MLLLGRSEQRRVRRVAAVTCALAVGTVLTLGPASASPGPPAGVATSTTTTTTALAGLQAQAATIARTLLDEGRRLDRLAERFNRARLNAERVRAEVVGTIARLADMDIQMQAVRRIVVRQAIADYVLGGQTANLALTGGKATDIVDIGRRHAYASTVANAKQDALNELRRLHRQMERARNLLANEQRAADADLAQVAADRDAAAAAANAEQTTLNRVKGDLATMVAAQQARLAAEQSARVQAALLARRVSLPPVSVAPAATPRAPPAPPAPTPRPISPPMTAPVRSTTTTTSLPPLPGNQPARGWQTAVAAAQAELGKPYQWGAAGPASFDCSGLTMWSWAKAGVWTLQHLAQAQYAETRPVAIADLLPGDLVFYGTPSDVHHVGIYVGAGTMIDAPETGDFVHYTTIYFDGLLAGGRIID